MYIHHLYPGKNTTDFFSKITEFDWWNFGNQLVFQENTFFRDRVDESQERIFYVKKIDRDQPLLSGVIVQEYDHNGLKRILNADQAFLDNGKWVFIKGVMYEVGSRGEVERVVRFEKEEMYTQQSMEDVLKSQKNPQEMSYKELQEYY